MNFRVINGVETVELSTAERRALEKAVPILETLGRKAESLGIKEPSHTAAINLKVVLDNLDAQAVDTDA